jgi:MFS family permease
MGDVSARPPRFAFRAWINVAVAAFLMVATLPGRSVGLGLLTEPILRDFPLTHVDFGQINFWATILGATFCLPAGWLIDRIGVRVVTTAVLAALGGIVYAMTATTSVWSLAILIFLTRGFGQSALSVVSLGVAGKTRLRNRAFAMGVFTVLMGVGLAVAVQTIRYAEQIQHADWRTIWSSMSGALIVSSMVFPLLISHLRGGPTDTELAESANSSDFTLGQSLRTPAFWAVALTCAFFNLVSSGTTLFYEDMLKSFGFPRDDYESLLGVTFLMGIGFNLLCGWLGRFLTLSRLLGFGSIILAGSLLALPFARTMSQLYVYGIAAAFAGGAVMVVFFTIWRPLFGATHVGKVLAAAQLLTVVASALGQWVFPVVASATGSYVPLLDALAVIAAGLGVWTCFVRPPQRTPARYTDPSSATPQMP